MFRIAICEDEKQKTKVQNSSKKAKKDQDRNITYDLVNRPEVANILMLISLCTGEEPTAIVARIGDGGSGMLKNIHTEALNEKLRPLREKCARLEKKDPEYIRKVLLDGIAKA